MTSNPHTPKDRPTPPPLLRGEDRRGSDTLSAPPYATGDGLVTVDRRSHLERRSCWIRDFRLEVHDKEH